MSTPWKYFPTFANKEKCLKAVVEAFGFEGNYVHNTANAASVQASYGKKNGKIKT